MISTEFPLPDWAIGKTDNYLTIGAQLCTRDGRRCGNAAVICINENNTALIKTDMGTELTLDKAELEELFHLPQYVMDVTEYIQRTNIK